MARTSMEKFFVAVSEKNPAPVPDRRHSRREFSTSEYGVSFAELLFLDDPDLAILLSHVRRVRILAAQFENLED